MRRVEELLKPVTDGDNISIDNLLYNLRALEGAAIAKELPIFLDTIYVAEQIISNETVH